MVAEPVLLILLAAAAVVLVGLLGLVLLVVGLVRKWVAMWVCGLLAIVLAGLVLLVATPLMLFACMRHSSRAVSRRAMERMPMPSPEGGDYVRSENGRTLARVEGVDIEVLAPGGGGTRSSTRSRSSGFRGRSEMRHELGVGNVEIVVLNRDGLLTFSVDGRDGGPLRPGDRIVVTEDRNVLVNGDR
ncbi:MAG: hypothetical protein IMZ55_18005, partial [Acidobacteria bacterium]|nr:hypothetical protein [Acidobacteriota bacterium]